MVSSSHSFAFCRIARLKFAVSEPVNDTEHGQQFCGILMVFRMFTDSLRVEVLISFPTHSNETLEGYWTPRNGDGASKSYRSSMEPRYVVRGFRLDGAFVPRDPVTKMCILSGVHLCLNT